MDEYDKAIEALTEQRREARREAYRRLKEYERDRLRQSDPAPARRLTRRAS